MKTRIALIALCAAAIATPAFAGPLLFKSSAAKIATQPSVSKIFTQKDLRRHQYAQMCRVCDQWDKAPPGGFAGKCIHWKMVLCGGSGPVVK